jgi:hypothetical protein
LNLPTARAGSNSTSPSGRAYIIPFHLPTLAPGTAFSSASFTVYEAEASGSPSGGPYGTYPNGTNANFSVDLYGLAAQTTSTVLAGDYYEGTLDATPGTTLLQANIATPSATPVTDAAPITTSTAGGAALAAYLNTEYALAGPGDWVFLRLSADADSGLNTNISYTFYTFDQSTNAGQPVGVTNGATLIPSITYSTAAVPEPATARLIASSAVMISGRRRRRCAGLR